MPKIRSNKKTNSGDTPPAVDDQTADGVITAASVVAFMPNANKVIPPEKILQSPP